MNYAKRILPLQRQGEVRNRWLTARLETLLPKLMKECEIDMWLVFSQESNEDPVMKTLLPSPLMSSLRRTLLLFFLKDDGTLEMLSLGRPGSALDKVYKSVWTNQKGSDWTTYAALVPNRNIVTEFDSPPESQMECLKRHIDLLSPNKIGLNFSQNTAYGDGLSHGMFLMLSEGMGAQNAAKIVSAEKLCTRWLETRLPEEIEAMTGLVTLTAELIKETFSSDVVHPGVTTSADLERRTMKISTELGLKPWFSHTATIRRSGEVLSGETVIRPGDILHYDLGLEYLGLCSDIQVNAYVTKLGETRAPDGIEKLFEQGKRLQDIVCDEMTKGKSGNEILTASLLRAEKEGIRGMIYCHAIGTHGHAAGTSIGRVDNQKFLEHSGEGFINDNTAYALELNVSGAIPEWGGALLTLGIETDIVYTGGKVEYFYRQNELFII